MSLGIISAHAATGGGTTYSSSVLSNSPTVWARLNDSVTNWPVVVAASASSFYPGPPAEPATMAFDGDASTFWETNGTSTGWVQAQLAVAVALTGYSLTSRSGFTTRAPKDWTFQGSNDGSTWTTLDTRTGVTSWTGGDTKTFTFSNSTAYLYYRVNVTANNGNAYLTIVECNLASALTAQSSWADSSGNARNLVLGGGSPPVGVAAAPKSTSSSRFSVCAPGHLRTTYTQNQPTVGTYEIWVYMNGGFPPADLVLATWVPPSTGFNGGTSALYLLSTGKLRLFVYNGATVNIDSPSALSVGGWHHCIGSWGAAGAKIRVDKSTLATNGAVTSASPPVAASSFRIHGYYNGSVDQAHVGDVDVAEAAWYPTQLSDAATDSNYDAA